MTKEIKFNRMKLFKQRNPLIKKEKYLLYLNKKYKETRFRKNRIEDENDKLEKEILSLQNLIMENSKLSICLMDDLIQINRKSKKILLNRWKNFLEYNDYLLNKLSFLMKSLKFNFFELFKEQFFNSGNSKSFDYYSGDLKNKIIAVGCLNPDINLNFSIHDLSETNCIINNLTFFDNFDNKKRSKIQCYENSQYNSSSTKFLRFQILYLIKMCNFDREKLEVDKLKSKTEIFWNFILNNFN